MLDFVFFTLTPLLLFMLAPAWIPLTYHGCASLIERRNIRDVKISQM